MIYSRNFLNKTSGTINFPEVLFDVRHRNIFNGFFLLFLKFSNLFCQPNALVRFQHVTHHFFPENQVEIEMMVFL